MNSVARASQSELVVTYAQVSVARDSQSELVVTYVQVDVARKPMRADS